MKIKEFIVVIFAILILIFVIYLVVDSSKNQVNPITNSNNSTSTMPLRLTSSAFENNGNIPAKYTCDGANIIPPLSIGGVDMNAQAVVLVVDDPDAASVIGHTFDHWVKFNMAPVITEIEEGKEPIGTSGKGGSGQLTYTGPCPPVSPNRGEPNGTHHYHFKLYSLDQQLGLPEGATKAEVEAAMQGHILQQTELIGLYNRSV